MNNTIQEWKPRYTNVYMYSVHVKKNKLALSLHPISVLFSGETVIPKETLLRHGLMARHGSVNKTP